MIHIKRFRYSEISREKISTDVIFPLKGLDLGPYLSSDRAPLERGGAPSSDQNNEALNGSIRNDICCNSKFSEQSSPVDSRILGPNSSIFDQNSDPADSTMPQTPVPSETHTDAPFDSDQYPPIYDLTGVSHHCGTLSGGHYVAHVDTNPATKSSSDHHNTADQSVDSTFRAELNSGSDSQDRCARDASSGGQGEDARWMCFNDEQVSAASPVDIIGPTAYVLFYRLREY